MTYGPGDVVTVNAWYSHIQPGTKATFISYSRYKGKRDVCTVEQKGFHFIVNTKDVSLYRRHIDSPHRKADNKRFIKLHPPTKR